MIIKIKKGNNVEEFDEKYMRKRKGFLSFFLSMVAMFFLFIAIIIFVLYNQYLHGNTIQSGVFIKDVNVSGLTKEEAKQAVQNKLSEQMKDHVILKHNNNEYYLAIEQIESSFDLDSATNYAYDISKKGNFFKDSIEYLKVVSNKLIIDPKITYNEEGLDKYISDLETQLPEQVIQSSYYIDDESLIITSGKEGVGIVKNELKRMIIDALQDISYSNRYVDIPTYTKAPDDINIDEIYQEPVNASFTKEPYSVTPQINGVDLKISLEEAKNMLNEKKDEYEIPLKISEPEVTNNMLGMEAFPDLLATFSTKYAASNTNRTTNLKLAAAKIDGYVLMPGETFSYNKVVGERTIAAGYKEAAIYSDGQVTNGLGGGICQISSTLYNSVIFANLDIVSRRNHMFIPSYVTGGRDATVVYGSTDFKFKNSREYPVKITASVSGGIAKISIYGLREDIEYDISIEAETVKTINYSTIYQKNSSYRSGAVIQSGAKGSVVQSYKVYRLNGEVVKREKLYRDTYNAMNRIIAK